MPALSRNRPWDTHYAATCTALPTAVVGSSHAPTAALDKAAECLIETPARHHLEWVSAISGMRTLPVWTPTT